MEQEYFEFRTVSESDRGLDLNKMRDCPFCGKPIAVNSLNCLYCGKTVYQSKTRAGWMIPAVLFLILSFLAMLFF